MSKNVFKLLQEVEQFKKDVYPVIVEAFEHNKVSTLQLVNFSRKINEKLLTYVASTDIYRNGMEQIKNDKPEYLKELNELFENVQFNSHYSKWNVILWIKRAYREYSRLATECNTYSKIAIDYLSDLKDLYSDLEPHEHLENVSNAMYQLNDYREDLLKIKSFELEFLTSFSLIESVLAPDKLVNVNDFLSVINVQKDKYTQNTINTLPKEIGLDELLNLIFVERVEDDEESFMHDLMMKQLFKFRKNNPKAAKQMDANLGLDLIPTYTVAMDAFGEVVDIERNKPNLRLV